MDAVDKSDRGLGIWGKMGTSVGMISLVIDSIPVGTMGGLFPWGPYYVPILLEALEEVELSLF